MLLSVVDKKNSKVKGTLNQSCKYRQNQQESSSCSFTSNSRLLPLSRATHFLRAGKPGRESNRTNAPLIISDDEHMLLSDKLHHSPHMPTHDKRQAIYGPICYLRFFFCLCGVFFSSWLPKDPHNSPKIWSAGDEGSLYSDWLIKAFLICVPGNFSFFATASFIFLTEMYQPCSWKQAISFLFPFSRGIPGKVLTNLQAA